MTGLKTWSPRSGAEGVAMGVPYPGETFFSCFCFSFEIFSKKREGFLMSRTTMIHARVPIDLKEEVTKILKKVGLSATEAITLFYSQVKLHKGIPFPVRIFLFKGGRSPSVYR